jgi:hypothetical protein
MIAQNVGHYMTKQYLFTRLHASQPEKFSSKDKGALTYYLAFINIVI